MTPPKHSPTPFSYDSQSGSVKSNLGIDVICPCEGFFEVSDEDMAFILRAVNNHGALIKALTDSTYIMQSVGGTHRDIAQDQILRNQLALAAAQGEGK